MDAEGQQARDAIMIYDTLVRDLRKKLSPHDCKMVDMRLASIQLPNRSAKQDEREGTTTPDQPVADGIHLDSVQRYLGEASDIRFFRTVKATFGQQDPEVPEAQVDSYEQDGIRPGVSEQDGGCLPDRTAADNLVNIYFATIHIAYPFISEPEFRTTYEKFWQSESLEGFRPPWLSTLCESHKISSESLTSHINCREISIMHY